MTKIEVTFKLQLTSNIVGAQW